MNAFDPHSLSTSPIKPATAPVSKSPKRRAPGKRKAPKSETTPDTATGVLPCGELTEEIAKQKRLIVAAHALLDELAVRPHEPHSASSVAVEPHEVELLYAAFPELKNLHDLGRKVRSQSAVRAILSAGVSRQLIRQLEAELADAEAAEQTVPATVDLDSLAEKHPLAAQVAELNARCNELRTAAQEARTRLSVARRDYAFVLSKAPRPLHDRVDSAITRVWRSPDGTRLQLVERRVEGIRTRWASGRHYDLHEAAVSGMWWAYLEREAPEAISEIDRSTSVRRRTIKATEFHAHRVDQVEKVLPSLEAEAASLRPKVEAAVEDVREPLHQWAETGRLTVEML